jgi:NADH-quinone oxidoreductase subunit J
MAEIVFYILAAVTVATALAVVFLKNPMYSVLSLVVCFFSIAGHYVLLDAQFLAVTHIIVYAGAIMVLFLFVVMLLNLNADSEPITSLTTKLAAVVSVGLLLVLMTGVARSADNKFIEQKAITQLPEGFGQATYLGKVLFDDYVFPFEITSILFLSAMVGAVILAKKHVND